MGKLLEDISTEVLLEKDDTRSASLTKHGKKANNEISDMGFSMIKQVMTTGDNINHSEVNDYLDKADEINDDVDTVVFGLETDDNEIVKVYVAVPDADAFEKAMAERLGTEDDLEDVIADLAQEFDIVDVEWPDSDEEEDEESETQNSSGEDSSEAEAELNFDEPVKEHLEDTMATTFGERFKKRILSTEIEIVTEAKEERQWPTEIDEFAKSLTTPAQETILYLITLFGLPKEVIGSRKAIGEFRRNIIKVAREYAKQQTLKIWVNKLIKELDTSAQKEEDKKIVKEAAKSEEEKEMSSEDWEDPKLLKAARFRDTLPHGVPRLIFDVLIGLGVPQSMLTEINSSKVRNAIRTLSQKVRRTQRIRIYLNLTAETLGVKADDQTETAAHVTSQAVLKKNLEEETLVEEITDYVVTVKNLLSRLGVPVANLAYKSANVTRSLKTRKTQLNFMSILPKIEQFLTYLDKAERVKPEAAPITEAKSEDYDTAVRSIAIALGFPSENFDYKASMLVQAFRQRKQELNWSSLIGRMNKLLQYISMADTVKQESIKDIAARLLAEKIEQAKLAEMVTTKMKHDDEEETDVDKILKKSKNEEKKEDPAADVGKWNFASMGSVGLTMRARGIKLQFEDIVAERIAKSIGDGKAASVKDVNSERVVFSPRDRGRSYVITGLEKFPEGVKLSSTDIDNLLDALGSK